MPKKHRPHLVTVCLANAARSPTAQWLLQGQGYKVRSCGVSSGAIEPCEYGKHVAWADKIFVMENYMKKDLLSQYPSAEKKIEVLGIPEIGEPTCHIGLLTKISKSLNKKGFKTRDVQDLSKAQNACGNWFGISMNAKLRRRRYNIPHYEHVPEFEAEYKRIHPPVEPRRTVRELFPSWHAEEGARRMAQADKEEQEAVRAWRKGYENGRRMLKHYDKESVREALNRLGQRVL